VAVVNRGTPYEVRLKNSWENTWFDHRYRLCMKRGWAFEAHHCPMTPNVIWKT